MKAIAVECGKKGKNGANIHSYFVYEYNRRILRSYCHGLAAHYAQTSEDLFLRAVAGGVLTV